MMNQPSLCKDILTDTQGFPQESAALISFMDHQHENYCSLSLHLDWQQLSETCCHLLTNVAGEVPEENIYKLRITDMALDASVHLEHWEEAMMYGVKTLPGYR